MNILIENLLTQTFFILQNRKMYLDKKILYQYFVFFCPVWDNFSSETILYAIT